jgi:peroxiredoxin Q/BCP|tara:strand:- start:4011 stop:4316 length:306 start_codon:yes stop_codon:yes gene_type:complete
VKSLRSAFAILTENKIQVVGVSMDTIAEQRAFSDKFEIPFPLLCDTTGTICEAYRIEHPKSKPRRETFLFRNGVLVHHDRAVNPISQARDVITSINELVGD